MDGNKAYIEMAEGRYAVFPLDWAILNENEAGISGHACCLSIPSAREDGNISHFIYFSNKHANDFTAEDEERLYRLVDAEYPQFAMLRQQQALLLEEELGSNTPSEDEAMKRAAKAGLTKFGKLGESAMTLFDNVEFTEKDKQLMKRIWTKNPGVSTRMIDQVVLGLQGHTTIHMIAEIQSKSLFMAMRKGRDKDYFAGQAYITTKRAERRDG